jgi:hypothetical protein
MIRVFFLEVSKGVLIIGGAGKGKFYIQRPEVIIPLNGFLDQEKPVIFVQE